MQYDFSQVFDFQTTAGKLFYANVALAVVFVAIAVYWRLRFACLSCGFDADAVDAAPDRAKLKHLSASEEQAVLRALERANDDSEVVWVGRRGMGGGHSSRCRVRNRPCVVMCWLWAPAFGVGAALMLIFLASTEWLWLIYSGLILVFSVTLGVCFAYTFAADVKQYYVLTHQAAYSFSRKLNRRTPRVWRLPVCPGYLDRRGSVVFEQRIRMSRRGASVTLIGFLDLPPTEFSRLRECLKCVNDEPMQRAAKEAKRAELYEMMAEAGIEIPTSHGSRRRSRAGTRSRQQSLRSSHKRASSLSRSNERLFL